MYEYSNTANHHVHLHHFEILLALTKLSQFLKLLEVKTEHRGTPRNRFGYRGHVVNQQVSLGNSPDANAERQLWKQVPVRVPLLQRLPFEHER